MKRLLALAAIAVFSGCSGVGTGGTVATVRTADSRFRVSQSLGATTSGESAYPSGVPWPVPGVIAFDNYDRGGRDVGYHTNLTSNPGGAYRHDGVGIQQTSDTMYGNGFNIGWTENGNWYRYTVNVDRTARYDLTVRIASVRAAGGVPASLHFEDESGTNLSGAIAVPVTGGFQTWTTLATAVQLTAGKHTIAAAIDSGHASFNLNTMTFSTLATSTPTPVPTASAVATPTPAPSTSPSPSPRPMTSGLPTTIVNNSGIAGWFYVLGSDASGVPMHVRPDGVAVANSLGDRDVTGHVDYGVPLAANGTTPFTFPHLNGRLYIALGKKLSLSVSVGANGHVGVSTPIGWNPKDSNYSVLHDWVEYAYSGTTFNVNVTGVDMYGLPLSMTLDGRTTQKSGSLPGARGAIFAGLRADPNFAGTVLSQGGIDLRALSPGHAADLGLFSKTYLDPSITSVWDYYTTHPYIIANQPGVSGKVSAAGVLEFTKAGAPYISFAKPTTLNVFGCDGAIISPNTPAGGIGSDLCAALNRGTAFAASQPDTNAADFYLAPLTNVYARVIHKSSIGGKGYGFPYDDNGGFSSFIADGQPRAFTITIEHL